MKPLFVLLLIIISAPYYSYGQAPPNDNCANATLLSSGSTCTSGYEANGTVQSGEIKPTCGAGGNNNNKSVWYKFVADSTSMYVQMYLTGILNGNAFNEARWAMEAYNTSSCLPGAAQHFSPDQCTHAAAVGDSDNIMELNLSGLTINNTYLLQVYYQPGNGAPTPQFCISVGKSYSRLCSTCNSACGAACVFTYAPTTIQVKTSCTEYKRLPYLEGGVSTSQCYTFTANSPTMYFEVETERACTTPTPSFPISWTLYNSSCGSTQTGSGNYGSTKALTNLMPGQSYTLCYTFTSDLDCYIIGYYPYVYHATILPIELISFNTAQQNEAVVLNWSTSSETNSDYFSIQRSIDGSGFDEIARINAAGNSTNLINYTYTDRSPSWENYYRLVQHDFDGAIHLSDVISVKVNTPLTSLSVIPNPVVNSGSVVSVVSDADRDVSLIVLDAIGRLAFKQTKTLHQGQNIFNMDFTNLPLGIYNLMLLSSDGNEAISFIK